MIGNKEIHIRHFSLSDLDRIMEIERVSFTTDAFSKAMFIKWHRKCPDLFIVAEILGVIVGYAITCILPKKGDVVSIAVDPLHRRKGIGQALMDYTLKKLKSSGVNVVELEVRKTNIEGTRFWESLGFSTIKIIPHFYGEGVEALRMRKLLDKN